jgi:uncharacterized protein YbbC (DUF1343 family)
MQILLRLLILSVLVLSFSTLSAQEETTKIKLGIDVLESNNFEQVKGKSIALLTNHAGRNQDGKLTLEVLKNTNSCVLFSILTPEHGFYTTIPAGKHIGDQTLFNLPMNSLYGSNRRPTHAQLRNIDAVVVDLQDIGVRSYTYISTLYNTLDACAEHGKEVIILDRPNPIGGMIVDGNVLDTNFKSFIGIAPIAYIHGMTFGELATMFNNEGWLQNGDDGTPRKCKLTVVKMQGWQRWMAWEDTGLEWYPTSPNIPTIASVRGIAMLGIFGELGCCSIGIGTTLPFQYLGTQNMNVKAMEIELGTLGFPGLNLVPTRYQTGLGRSGKQYYGFLLKFPLNNLFMPYSYGTKIMLSLRKLHPQLFTRSSVSPHSKKMFVKATGTDQLFGKLMGGGSDKEVMKAARKGLEGFMILRQDYLLY